MTLFLLLGRAKVRNGFDAMVEEDVTNVMLLRVVQDSKESVTVGLLETVLGSGHLVVDRPTLFASLRHGEESNNIIGTRIFEDEFPNQPVRSRRQLTSITVL